MAWITPITNWDTTNYYNFGDLNRVESNTNEIATLIGTFQTTPSLVGVKTNWANTDVPNKNDLSRVESNIQILKDATATPLTWQTPKTTWASLDKFDYTDANRLENNLLNLYNMTNGIIASFQYCGAIYSGQTVNFGGL